MCDVEAWDSCDATMLVVVGCRAGEREWGEKEERERKAGMRHTGRCSKKSRDGPTGRKCTQLCRLYFETLPEVC